MLRLNKGMLVTAAILLAALVAGCPEQPEAQPADPGATVTITTSGTVAAETAATAVTARLPRLVDLGRGTCIPCKMMAPILEQLQAEYAGRVTVEVIDLTEDPEAAQEFGVRTIPTQVFYDANGNEVSRHEGFLPKEEIVKIFGQLGVR